MLLLLLRRRKLQTVACASAGEGGGLLVLPDLLQLNKTGLDAREGGKEWNVSLCARVLFSEISKSESRRLLHVVSVQSRVVTCRRPACEPDFCSAGSFLVDVTNGAGAQERNAGPQPASLLFPFSKTVIALSASNHHSS